MIARHLPHPWAIAASRESRQAPVDRAEMLILVVSVLALLSVCILTMAADRPSSATIEVSVRPGDTLWSLAEQYGDPNKYILARIDDLRQANGLKRGRPLYEGQVLKVPNFELRTSNVEHRTTGG